MTQVQPTDYSLPGVMRYLQTEWQRNERDRIQWELEKAEMKTRIAKLEGENRGLQVVCENQAKKIKILEAAAKSEGGTDLNGLLTEYGQSFDEWAHKSSHLDLSGLIESRQYLEKCVQEVEYLLQSSSLEALPDDDDNEQQQQHQQYEEPPQMPKRPMILTRDKSKKKDLEPSPEPAVTNSSADSINSVSSGDNTRQWRERHTLDGYSGHVTAMSVVSHNSIDLATGSEDGTIKLWDITYKQKPIGRDFKGHDGPITALAHSAQVDVLFSGGQDGAIHGWDLEAKFDPSDGGTSDPERYSTFVGHSGIITSLAARGEKTLISAATDGLVKVWDTQENKTVNVISPGGKGEEGPSANSLDAFSEKVVVGYEDSTVQLYDIETGQSVVNFKVNNASLRGRPSPINKVCYLFPKGLVMSGHQDGTIRFLDTRNGQCVHIQKGHPRAVTALSLAPTGGNYVTGSSDGTIKIWSTSNQQPVQQIQNPQSSIFDVKWLSSTMLASFCSDSLVGTVYEKKL
uniref:ARAD1C03366p n=1 Tax=Blastobotrys adeninivorans TaxID=409370 RepID=A0A060T568_BLAAD